MTLEKEWPTYDFLQTSWCRGIYVEDGDLLLQTGEHACIWKVVASSFGTFEVHLFEEGSDALVMPLEKVPGPIFGVYLEPSLPAIRARVVEEQKTFWGEHARD